MKWLTKLQFNIIDVVGVSIGTQCVFDGMLLTGLIIVITTTFLSVALEEIPR